MRPVILALALLPLAAAEAFAQPAPTPADVAEGHQLALALCSVCHVAAADQVGAPMMTNPGPPFRDIANNPAITPAAIRTFLVTTHSTTTPPFTMPDPHLTNRQIDGVVAYILSLRTAQ